MERTIVKVQCVSKKQTIYGAGTNQHAIEFQVPYSPNNIFFQMSGGTTLLLNTINQEAAAMFEIGGNYELSLCKAEETTGN